MQALINGSSTDSISVLDRGLAYGDGLFETLKVVHRAPVFWEQHRRRLLLGCERLGIELSDVFLDALEAELDQLCRSTNDQAVLKLIVTRGAGGRGYRAGADLRPNRILTLTPFPSYPQSHYDQGVDVRLCQTRLSQNAHLAGIKHLNRLEQVLARREWGDDFAEGLLRDCQDRVIEGTMSNLFALFGNRVVTPELSQSGVRGIVREWLCDWVRQHPDLSLEEGNLDIDQLQSADLLLLTNSIIGIWPVKRLEGTAYTVHPLMAECHRDLARSEADSIQQWQQQRGSIDS